MISDWSHLPAYLRVETPPVAICGRCSRKTWDDGAVGTTCKMTQPDGNPCFGLFSAPGPYYGMVTPDITGPSR